MKRKACDEIISLLILLPQTTKSLQMFVRKKRNWDSKLKYPSYVCGKSNEGSSPLLLTLKAEPTTMRDFDFAPPPAHGRELKCNPHFSSSLPLFHPPTHFAKRMMMFMCTRRQKGKQEQKLFKDLCETNTVNKQKWNWLNNKIKTATVAATTTLTFTYRTSWQRRKERSRTVGPLLSEFITLGSLPLPLGLKRRRRSELTCCFCCCSIQWYKEALLVFIRWWRKEEIK